MYIYTYIYLYPSSVGLVPGVPALCATVRLVARRKRLHIVVTTGKIVSELGFTLHFSFSCRGEDQIEPCVGTTNLTITLLLTPDVPDHCNDIT